MTINEIEMRLAAIRDEIAAKGEGITDAELTAYEQEIENLTSERSNAQTLVERRNKLLASIAAGEKGEEKRGFLGMLDESASAKPDDPRASAEFRSAWAKKMRGETLSAVELRAYSSATSTYGPEVIPTEVANEILTKAVDLAPILDDITLLHVNGKVSYPVQGTNNAAALHTENASITAAADTLSKVDLAGYEIAKLVQISDAVKNMSIPAFEGWLIETLGTAIADKINDYIVNGTGSSQPGGINAANTWGATNSVTVAASASLTSANVQALIGLLPEAYDEKAKFVMSKRTLFTDFMPLQDNSKNSIVTVEGKNYFVYGYPVRLSSKVTLHNAFLGDLTKYVGNLAEDITVKNDFDIDTNSYKYLGVALFDGKAGLGEAFVKLAKATS